MLTTTIGSYPKPPYLDVPDWFKVGTAEGVMPPGYAEAVARLGERREELFRLAAGDAVRDQVKSGIDIPTDGEVRRENYMHYHCRHLVGIDFAKLRPKSQRAGAFVAKVPTVTGPIGPREHFLPRDYEVARSFTDKPVKITIPGPSTLADTLNDDHYGDLKALTFALADAINWEIMALADAGCRHIQLDEPVFSRMIAGVMEYGFEALERAFHGCPAPVTRIVHICCSYPDTLDHPSPPKAPKESYFKLAEPIDRSSIDAVSIEDAHRHNDLALLEKFSSTGVILGAVDIGKSRVEPVDEIRARLGAALAHIDRDRLVAAPDCGLGLLGRELAIKKMRNLAAAARMLS